MRPSPKRLRSIAADLRDIGDRLDLWQRRDAPTEDDQRAAAAAADDLFRAAALIRRAADGISRDETRGVEG